MSETAGKEISSETKSNGNSGAGDSSTNVPSVKSKNIESKSSENRPPTAKKPSSSSSASQWPRNQPQQPRRGSFGNQYSYYQQHRRGKGQRHFSHGGGEEFGMGEGKNQYPGNGRRRHSTEGKNKKKPVAGGEATSGAASSGKLFIRLLICSHLSSLNIFHRILGQKTPKFSSGRYRNSFSESAQNGSGDFDYYTDDCKFFSSILRGWSSNMLSLDRI